MVLKKLAVGCAVGITAAAAVAQVAPARVAAIGDSLTDEYAEQTYGGVAKSWTQLLVESGRIDMGPTAAEAGIADWGEPRRTGYRDNWARYSATTDWIAQYNQDAGAAASVSGGAEYVVIFIGGNDLAPWTQPAYDNVYSGAWRPEDAAPYLESRLANIERAVDAVQGAGAKVVLASPPDFGFMPWVYGALRLWSPGRDRVSLVETQFRDGLRAMALRKGVVFLDMMRLVRDLFGDNINHTQSVVVGGHTVRLAAWGDQHDVGFIDDGSHPQTVVQAIWGAAFVTALNRGYGAGIPPVTERDMLRMVGFEYSADTLGQFLPPLGSYVQSFRCPADFNVDSTVSVQDIFDFLAAYFAGDIRADMNGSKSVSVEDVFTFLGDYFTGCPG